MKLSEEESIRLEWNYSNCMQTIKGLKHRAMTDTQRRDLIQWRQCMEHGQVDVFQDDSNPIVENSYLS